MNLMKIINKADEEGLLIEPIHVYEKLNNRSDYSIYVSSKLIGEIKVIVKKGNKNSILCGQNCKVHGVNISINGNNNTVIFGAHSVLKATDIRITGDNNLFYFGAFSTVGSMIVMLDSSNGSIKIGDFCMLSNRIMIDNSDHHSIYDLKTGEKVNHDKDVYIGNHVWIGRDVRINKGVYINPDVIVGQGSIVNGILLEKSLYAGIPCRILRKNVTWSRMESEFLSDMESSERNLIFIKKVNKFKQRITNLKI